MRLHLEHPTEIQNIYAYAAFNQSGGRISRLTFNKINYPTTLADRTVKVLFCFFTMQRKEMHKKNHSIAKISLLENETKKNQNLLRIIYKRECEPMTNLRSLASLHTNESLARISCWCPWPSRLLHRKNESHTHNTIMVRPLLLATIIIS